MGRDPGHRVRKPAPQVFGDFEQAYVCYAQHGGGRHIYQANGCYIVAATDLQALKAWVAHQGSPVERLARDELHALTVEALKARTE